MSNLDLNYFNPNKDKLYQKLTYFLIKGTTTKLRNKYLGIGMKIIGFTGMLEGGKTKTIIRHFQIVIKLLP